MSDQADEIIRIPVTAEDIENGTRRTNDLCPIALAITRYTGDPLGYARVYEQFILIDHDGDRLRDAFDFDDRKVAERIRRFDQGQRVKPFTLVLDRTSWKATAEPEVKRAQLPF